MLAKLLQNESIIIATGVFIGNLAGGGIPKILDATPPNKKVACTPQLYMIDIEKSLGLTLCSILSFDVACFQINSNLESCLMIEG